MKVTSALKLGSRKSVFTLDKLCRSYRLTRSKYRKPRPEREIVQKFRQEVRKRPATDAWLIHYGQLGRQLGLTYPETFLVVKAQVRRLRGNAHLWWVHRGLLQGYNMSTQEGWQNNELECSG